MGGSQTWSLGGLTFLLVAVFVSQIVAREPVRQGAYDSSYAFLNVRSADTSAEASASVSTSSNTEAEPCLQFVEDAVPYRIAGGTTLSMRLMFARSRITH
uniref:Uncharacterized protein n=1 Tax=Ditylenchus dipsaci TaxID=166011 RepID=A0A915DNZ2_9BILA